MKMCQAVLNLWSGHETIVNTQRVITPKKGKTELRFMCSARRLMVYNVCVFYCLRVFKIRVKFHENMSSGFKVMERIRKF